MSSGGYMGMAVVLLVGIIVLNKRIFKWWRSVLILLAITLVVGGITYDRWSSELSGSLAAFAPSRP